MYAGDKGAFFVVSADAPSKERACCVVPILQPERQDKKKTRVTLMEKFLIFSHTRKFPCFRSVENALLGRAFYERGCSAQVFMSSVDN
jgi:hypothetical protein